MSRTIATGLLVGILGIVLAGCVFSRDSPFVDEAGNPVISPPLPQDQSMAVVFFYRPPRFGLSGVSPTLSVYGQRELLVGRLHNSGYTWIRIPPGKYTFRAWLPSHLAGGEKSISFDVDGGQKYYIQVLLERYFFVVYTHDVFKLIPLPAPQAEKEITATHYIRPERVTFSQ
jgi:hypothetical protein